MVYADENRRRCTSECTFTSRDDRLVEVSAAGVIRGVGRGRTVIDVTASIDGVRLVGRVSVYVLTVPVIAGVTATTAGKPWKSHNELMHSPVCLVSGQGTDGPDTSSLHRANSYGFGLFLMEPGDDGGWIRFDLGAVQAVDELWVWNYNCPDDYRVLWWNGGTAQGMRDIKIEYSEDGEQWQELRTEGHPFRLARATGRQWMPASNLDDGRHSPIRFHGARARYVRLTPDPRDRCR